VGDDVPVAGWNQELPPAACAAIIPSRGRPGAAEALLDLAGHTSVCTELVFCLDGDDPALNGYKHLMTRPFFSRQRVSWYVGPRRSLTGWTNRIARQLAPGTRMLFSLGDDHRPQTQGWDRKLLEAAEAMGGGWAYGDDGLQHENLPTAFGVSSRIVEALGWMLLESCAHMFVDAAARDLAEKCGRRAYLPQVKISHLHYTSGLSPLDQVYIDGYASWAADEAAYRAWLAGPIRDDAEKVRAACR